MKSSEFIKENVKVQKPLRPTKPVVSEDDLDEIDRRGFLKGAGAAAVGAAGLAGAKTALSAQDLSDADMSKIDNLLTSYYFFKTMRQISDSPEKNQPLNDEIKIKEEVNVFIYKYKNGREFISTRYSAIYNQWDPITYGKNLGPEVEQNWIRALKFYTDHTNVERFIIAFKSLSEF